MATLAAQAYDSNQTNHNPNLYQTNASFVYSDKYTAPVLELLNAQPGERILDIGCGSGEVTERIRGHVESKEGGIVWGTDSNQPMLDTAATQFPELKGHLFQGDAQALDVPPELEANSFDSVFTTATLHWCKRDPPGVISSVKKFLKKGGKFVGEFGGFSNVSGIRSHLYQILEEKGYDAASLDPWYFPTADQYKELLEEQGFTVTHASLNPRLTPLPTTLKGWLATFARNSFLSTLDDDKAEEVIAEVARRSELDCRWPDKAGLLKSKSDSSEGTGEWAVMYVRLRFSATLE